jgi:hypothetical protein
MRLLRPQSLSSLVVLALAVIALPLIAALVTAGVQLRQISAASERIVAEGVATTRQTQRLAALHALLEGRAGRALVLGPEVLGGYAEQDAELAGVERGIADYLRNAEGRVALERFTQLRTGILARLRAGTATQADVETTFDQMERMAGVV